MDSFKQFLEEGRDAPLYHSTYWGGAEGILQSNAIKASSDVGGFPGIPGFNPGSKKNKRYKDKWGEIPFVSLTRNIRFAEKWAEVIFELDQRTLSQRHKMIPFSFFAGEFSFGGKPNPGRKGDREVDLKGDEWPYNQFEESVLGSINNVQKYIRKIIVDGKVSDSYPRLQRHPLLWDKRKKQYVNGDERALNFIKGLGRRV
jgi:hypothetical protein